MDDEERDLPKRIARLVARTMVDLRLLLKLGLVFYNAETDRYYYSEKAKTLSEKEIDRMIEDALIEEDRRTAQYMS